ncbi:MAG: hypothetical protein ABMA64_38205 [Myxococcota bacterium]
MNRLTIALWLAGCHRDGGAAGDATSTSDPLPTTTGVYSAAAEVVENDCEGFGDGFEGLEIRFDQVSTGMSVFIDPDIGWIPCAGSIEAFDCRWGNAPPSTPSGSWDWSFAGTTDDGWLDATLTLTVTCAQGGGTCEPCTLVEHVTGPFDG